MTGITRGRRVACALACALLVLVVCACVPMPPAPTPMPAGPTSTPLPTATPEPAPAPEPTSTPTSTPKPSSLPTPPVTPSAPATSSTAATLSALAKLPNDQHGWGFLRRDDHVAPKVAGWIATLFAKYRASYRMVTRSKVVYLTMDEGYENGFTPEILDTLAAKGVRAAFFCTGTFMRDNPGLVKRMMAEGHLVANHTWDHPNMVTKAKSYTAYRQEIAAVEEQYAKVTGGSRLPKLVRMPSSKWSERCLAYNRYLGYRTYFWSFAYRDWETANQPDPDAALELILANTHPGEIMLLHAVSRTNTEILADVIDGVRGQGYEFGVLPH